MKAREFARRLRIRKARKTEDQLIEEKIDSEIKRSSFGSGSEGPELIAVLKLDWRRLKPGVDVSEHGLTYVGQNEHIYFVSECLVLSEGRIQIISDAWLYRKAFLLELGEGSQAAPDDRSEIARRDVDLAGDLPDAIVKAIVGAVRKQTFTAIAYLIFLQEDYKGFLKTIKNPRLRRSMKRHWARTKKNYI